MDLGFFDYLSSGTCGKISRRREVRLPPTRVVGIHLPLMEIFKKTDKREILTVSGKIEAALKTSLYFKLIHEKMGAMSPRNPNFTLHGYADTGGGIKILYKYKSNIGTLGELAKALNLSHDQLIIVMANNNPKDRLIVSFSRV